LFRYLSLCFSYLLLPGQKQKQSNVDIAVQMIRDVVLERYDISILVSADSDLIPRFWLFTKDSQKLYYIILSP